MRKIREGPKSKIPKTTEFITLQEAIQDPLTTAKLQFFITQAQLLKPYLKKYQSESPMMPFMAEDLYNILESTMKKFVRKSVIEESTTAGKLASIDLNKKENLKEPKKCEVGFAVRAITDKLEKSKKVTPLQMLEFQNECQPFLKALSAKMLERCPLKYPIVRYLTSLDPRFMKEDPSRAQQRFEKLLLKLLQCKRLSPEPCDSSKQQYERFLKEANEKLGLYMITQPVDKVFFKLLNEKEEYKDLWNVFRMMLVISHGQADIERGFSVNKDIANDNMNEKSFVAHRRVYHGVTSSGYELHEIPVTKEMLTLCKQSRQKYHEYREHQKKLKQLTKQDEEKKQLTSQLKEEQRT